MPESTVQLSIEGMTCPSCVYMIESELSDLNGVLEAKVNLDAKNAHVKYESSTVGPDDMLKMINGLSSNKFTAKLVSFDYFTTFYFILK
jgi:P-type Cu+ transporter